MERLGYAVVNLGERDLKLGYDEFVRQTESATLPFVSANLVRQATGEPLFPTHTVVEAKSADGTTSARVGVVGVMRPNPMFLRAGPDQSNMVLIDPIEPTRRSVAALKEEGVDYVVLLAAINKREAARIAGAVPGIDFVVGAYAGIWTSVGEAQGTTWILYSGNQGKRLGATRVFLDDSRKVTRQSTTMHFLTRAYPNHQEMLDFVNQVPRESDRGKRSSVDRAVEPFVGPQHASRPEGVRAIR